MFDNDIHQDGSQCLNATYFSSACRTEVNPVMLEDVEGVYIIFYSNEAIHQRTLLDDNYNTTV